MNRKLTTLMLSAAFLFFGVSSTGLAQRTEPGRPKPADTGAAPDDAVPGGEPKLELEKLEVDFGKVHTREPLVAKVRFKNVGDRKLHINRITTSCGCTTAKLPKMDYDPGEGGEIEITYKPKSTGKRSSKIVTISTNDATDAVQRVRVTAWLIEPARLEPARLQIGQIKAGEEHVASYTLVSPDIGVEIVKIDDESGLLEFEVEDEGRPDDPTFPGRKVIRARLSKNAPTGKLAVPFKVTTRASLETGGKPIESVLNGYLLGHIRGDLLTEPRFLRIKNAERNADFEERTLLFSESGKPFEILKTSLVDSMIEKAEIVIERADPVETGREGYWIVLKGNTGAVTGAFRGSIVIATDLPNEGAKKIQYNGVIRRTTPPRRSTAPKTTGKSK